MELLNNCIKSVLTPSFSWKLVVWRDYRGPLSIYLSKTILSVCSVSGTPWFYRPHGTQGREGTERRCRSDRRSRQSWYQGRAGMYAIHTGRYFILLKMLNTNVCVHLCILL